MSYSVTKESIINYSPAELRGFFVYGYEWIDNLLFLRDPDEFLEEPQEYINSAKELFLEAGWEGDGEIRLLWLPPFVFPLSLRVSPQGVTVWHVKQDNDGVSFLISPIELPFEEFGA